jgi:hypothetical protein
MFRVLILSLTFAFSLFPFPLLKAQADATHLRVSLLTVSPGDEIYAAFGHTGIRIADTVTGRDIVYNYGTFDGFDENFELKFARGKLLYSISSESFAHFMNVYVHEQRTVQEQELFLDRKQKRDLQAFLIKNEQPENRYYKYDFFYDNCATRIRDVFSKTFGAGFRFGQIIPPDSKVTFRQEVNYYVRGQHWERLGINLCLGSRIDVVMSNKDIMFLPDYLRDGIGKGTVNGQKIATAPVTILSMPPMPEPGPNGPFLCFLAFGLLVTTTLLVPALRPVGNFLGGCLLVATGLLGCFLMAMWLGTDHSACRYNWNVLWALPTNIMVPFIKRNGRSKYAVIGIVLVLATLALHITGIQEIALYELWPLLLALVVIFGMIYRLNKITPAQK